MGWSHGPGVGLQSPHVFCLFFPQNKQRSSIWPFSYLYLCPCCSLHKCHLSQWWQDNLIIIVFYHAISNKRLINALTIKKIYKTINIMFLKLIIKKISSTSLSAGIGIKTKHVTFASVKLCPAYNIFIYIINMLLYQHSVTSATSTFPIWGSRFLNLCYVSAIKKHF